MIAGDVEQLEALAARGPDDWDALLAAVPRLLDSTAQRMLEAMVAAAPDPAKVRPFVDHIGKRRAHLDAHPEEYPLGDGPIERVLRAMRGGQITLETACQLVRANEVASSLGSLYLRVLDKVVAARAEGDGWLDAVHLQALLLAATEALPALPDASIVRELIVLRGCKVVQRALIEAPDRFLFELARDAAQALLDSEAHAGIAGELHYRLGTLHLDPYTVGRATSGYDTAIDVWAQRSLPGRATDHVAPGIRGRGMPEPSDALRTASEHLALAAERFEGSKRGLCNKALLSALVFRRLALGEAIATDALCALADRALADLTSNEHLRERLAVARMRTGCGCPPSASAADPASPAALLEELSRSSAIDAFEIGLLVADDVSIAADERLRVVETVAARGNELSDLSRIHLASRELRLRFEVRFGAGTEPRDEDGLRDALEAWQAAGDGDAEGAALRAYQLAIACDLLGAEHLIPRLLAAGAELAPALQDDHPAFLVATGQLLSNAAAVAFNAGSHDAAAELSLRAAVCFDRAALAGSAVESLGRAADAIERSGLLGSARAFGGLVRFGPALETRLGPRATAAFHRMLTSALDQLDAPSLTPWLHALKGARFALALDAPQPASLDAGESAEVAALEELEASLSADALQLVYPSDPAGQEESLLASPLDREIRRDGAGDAVRLVNLQARFDRALAARIIGVGDVAPAGYVLQDDERRALLDERTVLVDLFWDTARRSLYTVLSTRDATFAGRSVLEAEVPTFIQVDGDVDLTPLGMRVQALRQRVVLDAEMRAVDSSAAEGLASLHEWAFAPVADALAELRAAGKDHLCIVPHAALHYAPLHLAGPPGAPLADDWIVTYLPNLRLLQPRPRQGARRSRTIAAYGVGFAGTAYALPESITEANDIARVFGETAQLDGDAHRDAILDGLANARYVHLGSHGRHNVVAPSFHSLFCGGGTVVRAYDLVGRDLRGLEVVTLSACETALGRFDRGDNLAGLPAALFLAGAETLVGTLWPVESDSAEVFFTSFYEALQGGASRLDAFAAAQRSTRLWSRAYRHWGAFYLSGAWR